MASVFVFNGVAGILGVPFATNVFPDHFLEYELQKVVGNLLWVWLRVHEVLGSQIDPPLVGRSENAHMRAFNPFLVLNLDLPSCLLQFPRQIEFFGHESSLLALSRYRQTASDLYVLFVHKGL